MTFELNPGKLIGLFAPFWLLLALSLAVNFDDWTRSPLLFVVAVGAPLATVVLLWALGRRRWRLELTPTAMVHHTLGRTERFDWDRMGPMTVSAVPGLGLVSPATLRFDYDGAGLEGAIGGLIGRRVLCVFGDRGGRRLLREITDYRRLHAGA